MGRHEEERETQAHVRPVSPGRFAGSPRRVSWVRFSDEMMASPSCLRSEATHKAVGVRCFAPTSKLFVIVLDGRDSKQESMAYQC
jgi:hypothetical protein